MKQKDKPKNYVYKGPRVAKAIMDKKSTRQPGRILPHMIHLTLHAVVTKTVWYWRINKHTVLSPWNGSNLIFHKESKNMKMGPHTI